MLLQSDTLFRPKKSKGIGKRACLRYFYRRKHPLLRDVMRSSLRNISSVIKSFLWQVSQTIRAYYILPTRNAITNPIIYATIIKTWQLAGFSKVNWSIYTSQNKLISQHRVSRFSRQSDLFRRSFHKRLLVEIGVHNQIWERVGHIKKFDNSLPGEAAGDSIAEAILEGPLPGRHRTAGQGRLGRRVRRGRPWSLLLRRDGWHAAFLAAHYRSETKQALTQKP